eukprot:GILI01035459.1.p1 GENE.GILI01035459.1~~GILI01035459.1.p1  ORF type:complete len:328 (+),score=53.87 GILI01035459.1:61-1044(+)
MPIIAVASLTAAEVETMRARLSSLGAQRKAFQEQHYQRQFTQCWERYGISTVPSASSTRQHPPHSGKRSRAQANEPTEEERILPRSSEIIHDLHLVGACEGHDSDTSSCDEGVTRERTRARQLIARLRPELSAAGSGGAVADGNDLATEASQADRIKVKERLITETTTKNIKALADRQRAKRELEYGLHKALHAPPHAQRRLRRTAASTKGGSMGIGHGGIAAQATFRLATLASVSAAERATDINASPLHAKLVTAIDRFRARSEQLRTMRKQANFTELGPLERVKYELSAVMKKRKEFHRVRGPKDLAEGRLSAGADDINDDAEEQ